MKLMMKAILGGVVATCLSLVLLYLFGLVGISLIARHSPMEQDGIGWDPVSALTPVGFVLYLAAMFALGFLWIFKRAAG